MSGRRMIKTSIKTSMHLREDAERAVMGVIVDKGEVDKGDIITAYLDQAWKLICAGEVRVARTFLREHAAHCLADFAGDSEAANFLRRLADVPKLEKLFSNVVESQSNKAFEKIWAVDKRNQTAGRALSRVTE